MSNEIRYVTPRYENLTRITKERKCKKFLEIGTWAGITAQNLILTAGEFADPQDIYYLGVDLFDLLTPEIEKLEHSKAQVLIANVKRKLSCFPANVLLYQGLSKDVIPSLPEHEDDLIFIDGGHRIETITQDWNDVQRFIGKNTVVVFDDYRHSQTHLGCKSLIDDLDRKLWDVEILEPTDELSFGKTNVAQVMRC